MGTLNILQGRNHLLPAALTALLRDSLDVPQLVVVPRQLTLETERMLLDRLGLQGSFHLQVLGTERFCQRIFEAAGQPEGVRLDDRGRVMLVRQAVRESRDRLTIYRGAERGQGFAERCAQELTYYRQASVPPEALSACAEDADGSARQKLRDLAVILERYEQLIEGRFQDGEVEFLAAAQRAADAGFLAESRVMFYGFDMVPPTLHRLMAAVAGASREAFLLMPIPGEAEAKDLDAFRPLRRACSRLEALCHEQDIPVCHTPVTAWARDGALAVGLPAKEMLLENLSRELFTPAVRSEDDPKDSLLLARMRDPREECAAAAALCHHLAASRGWRWGDMLVLCDDLDSYAQPLAEAFRAYGVPLFLASSRSAARHRLAEFLLTALRAVEKGFPADELLTLLSFDLLPVDADEAERLSNYMIANGIRGQRFFAPLTKGDDEALKERLEPVRAAVAQALLQLREGLKQKELAMQLKAVYDFLVASGAEKKSRARVDALAEQGLWELAGEEAQVWNRIMGTLDQLNALMGPGRMSIRELREVLTDALSATVIKALPQSGDAVFAQSTRAACMRPVKVILALGLVDRRQGDGEGLLDPAQRQRIVDRVHAYLGPDEADLSRLRRAMFKSQLGMASEMVVLSSASSDAKGSALRPGMVFDAVKRLFPKVRTVGGLNGDSEVERLLALSPLGSINGIARRMAGGEAQLTPADRASLRVLEELRAKDPRADQALRILSAAKTPRAEAGMAPETARRVYGRQGYQSISSLEKFAGCPFSYFARYALKPDVVQPYEFNAANEGTFFHAAVEAFLNASREDIGQLTEDEARRRMDAIAEEQLAALMEKTALGDNAMTKAEARRLKATARAAGGALARHLRGSRFIPADMEMEFGPQDGSAAIQLPGGVLKGIIDRLDLWEGPLGRFVRVVDYKRGGKKLELYKALGGLRLQLLRYLAVAEQRLDARPAGVFYFPLTESIVSTQTTQADEIEQMRGQEQRMLGLIPADPMLLDAFSPAPDAVVNAKFNKTGALSKTTDTADEEDFRRLIACVLAQAAAHCEGINAGSCDVSPAETDGKLPCTWCDYRGACLFEAALNGDQVRRFARMSNREVLELLREEEKHPEGNASGD